MIFKLKLLIFTFSLSLLTINFSSAKPIKDDSQYSTPPLVRASGYRMPDIEASPPRLQRRPRQLRRRFTHAFLNNYDQHSLSATVIRQLLSSHPVEGVQNSRISNYHRPQISSQLATTSETIRHPQSPPSTTEPFSLEDLLDPTSLQDESPPTPLPIRRADPPTVPVSPDSPSTPPLSREPSSSQNSCSLNR